MANRTPASSMTGSRDKKAPSAHSTPSISFASKEDIEKARQQLLLQKAKAEQEIKQQIADLKILKRASAITERRLAMKPPSSAAAKSPAFAVSGLSLDDMLAAASTPTTPTRQQRAAADMKLVAVTPNPLVAAAIIKNQVPTITDKGDFKGWERRFKICARNTDPNIMAVMAGDVSGLSEDALRVAESGLYDLLVKAAPGKAFNIIFTGPKNGEGYKVWQNLTGMITAHVPGEIKAIKKAIRSFAIQQRDQTTTKQQQQRRTQDSKSYQPYSSERLPSRNDEYES